MKITREIAKKAGNALKVDWNKINLDELVKGMEEEKEHDTGDKQTDVLPGSNNILSYAKIALAHLKEDPNYYTKLKKIQGDEMKEAVENRLAIVRGDDGLNLIDLNTGRKFATSVEKWDYKTFLKAFKELNASSVEVRADSPKSYLKDGFYRAKDFLLRLSKLNPAQGNVVPVVRGQPVQDVAAEGKTWAYDEHGTPYNESALLEKVLDYLEGSSVLQENFQGKQIELNKPFLNKDDSVPAKYSIFIKEGKTIKKVHFGIKK